MSIHTSFEKLGLRMRFPPSSVTQEFVDNGVKFEEEVAAGTFTHKVVVHLCKIGQCSVGKALFNELNQLQRSRFGRKYVKIKPVAGAAAYKSGLIWYDPELVEKWDRDNPFEPTMVDVAQNKMGYVYLFHELVHYYHDLQGHFSISLEEEIRTVGLYRYKNEAISENAFRAALNLPRRPCYQFRHRSPLGVIVGKDFYGAESTMRKMLCLPEQAAIDWDNDEGEEFLHHGRGSMCRRPPQAGTMRLLHKRGRIKGPAMLHGGR